MCLWRKGHTGVKSPGTALRKRPTTEPLGTRKKEMDDWLAKEKVVGPGLEDAGYPPEPPVMEGRQNLGSSQACQGLRLPVGLMTGGGPVRLGSPVPH